MNLTTALLVSVFAWVAPGDVPATSPVAKSPGGVIQARNGLVTMIDHVRLSSLEAGQLAAMKVDDGAVVSKGDVLGQLDDLQSLIKLEAAKAEVEMVKEEAESEDNIKAAKKVAEVAEAEHIQAMEINRKSPGTISVTEVRRLKVTWEKSLAQLEVEKLKQRIAKKTVLSKEASVKAVENEILRRKLIAPLDAIVDHVMADVGEYLQPGQPVIELIRIDRLRVEAFLNASDVSPHEIEGRDAVVEIQVRDPNTGSTKVEKFNSKVTFVSKQIVGDGSYRIAVDFDNRQVGENWAVWPGLTSTITIKPGLGKTAAVTPSVKPVSRTTTPE